MPWGDAVIFAGGRSSRMGKDKALLAFGGYDTLTEYQYRRLLPLFERVWISTKEDKFPFDAPLILDRHEASSPTVALAAALERAAHPWVFILSVDMPQVDAQLIDRLHAAAHGDPQARAVIARSPRGVEPLCGLYHRDLLPSVHAQLEEGEHRMQGLLRAHPTLEVPCEREAIFTNLNTPEEYTRLLARSHSGDPHAH